ncbi:trichohyalin-like isoform X2 [Alosa sapidissima]|uniref:trichohyalin-like isoform X2 n=1 Tax=Alosa sapidissima TaxID=34773 RepID=UPI001C096E31|nr:trichohyalin-like isoform X2 [Alosa sapidissima]
MGEQDSDSLRKKSLVKWRNLKMEDLSRQLDAKQLQIENDRHDNLTCQRQTTRMWREVLQWRPKTAEERNREEGDKKRLEETKETLRERDEENNVERDEKQDTGGINRHPETETEQGDVGSDLDKPPGLRNGVSNNGEKAEKEERESETGEAEFPRTQGGREMMDQSAADTAAVLGPIADEAGGPTGQDKEEKQSTEDGASGHEAEAAGHEAEAAGLSSPREEPHMAGEGGESVELRKGKKTRRGCRGKRNKKKKTDETVSSEDERKEEEEEEEEKEGSGQDSGIQHRRRVEERCCNGVGSPPEGELRQRFYPGRQMYSSQYYNRVQGRREREGEEEERRGRAQRDPSAQPFRDTRPGMRRPDESWRGGLYPRERWTNERQDATYARRECMERDRERQDAAYATRRECMERDRERQDAEYTRRECMERDRERQDAEYTRRECMERDRKMETGMWMETGAELWNRSREEVAMGTDMMRLSFWCPRGGERGEKWSYQRGRLQLVKRSAQKQHRPNWVGETRVAPC